MTTLPKLVRECVNHLGESGTELPESGTGRFEEPDCLLDSISQRFECIDGPLESGNGRFDCGAGLLE